MTTAENAHTATGESPFTTTLFLNQQKTSVAEKRLAAALPHLPEPARADLPRVLRGWLDSLDTAETARTYLGHVAGFVTWCATRSQPVDPLRIDRPSLDGFRRHLAEQPVHDDGSPRARQTRVVIESACANLTSYAVSADVAGVTRNRWVEKGRTKAPPSGHRRQYPAWTAEQFRRMADAAGRDRVCNSLAGRNYEPVPEGAWSPLGPLIVGLLGWSGMRSGAALCRLPVDGVGETVNAKGETVVTLTGPDKGRGDGWWQLSRELSATVWAWLRYRAQLAGFFGDEFLGEQGDPLLLSPQTGQALSARTVARRVRIWGQQAGVDGLTPHGLRHGFARLSWELGVSAEALQAALGHRDVRTTWLYGQPQRTLAAQPAEALRALFAESWPAPGDPHDEARVTDPPAHESCGCPGRPWSRLTADGAPLDRETGFVVEPSPAYDPPAAARLEPVCRCGVRYPPGWPVQIVALLYDEQGEALAHEVTELRQERR